MFFSRIPESLPPLNEWLYTRVTLRALKVSYSDVGEAGVAVKCEKKQFFLNTLYLHLITFLFLMFKPLIFHSYFFIPSISIHVLFLLFIILSTKFFITSPLHFSFSSLHTFLLFPFNNFSMHFCWVRQNWPTYIMVYV